MTSKNKKFGEWRAEKLGYVYFSRIKDLIISESQGDNSRLFDYLIDIGKKHHETGRLFGVEVKSTNFKKPRIRGEMSKYKNITIPALYVVFDSSNDEGFYKWIKKPANEKLILDSETDDFQKLNEKSLKEVVKEIENWYSHLNRHDVTA